MILKATKDNFLTVSQISFYTNSPFVFPTDTIYGIGASVYDIVANNKIFSIKKRSVNHLFPVLISDLAQLFFLAYPPNKLSLRLTLQDLWLDSSKPITVVLKSRNNNKLLFNNNSETIAIRLVKSPIWLKESIKITGPITATSVNITGNPPLNSAEDIYNNFNHCVPYILEGESNNFSSEIIDLSGENMVKLR